MIKQIENEKIGTFPKFRPISVGRLSVKVLARKVQSYELGSLISNSKAALPRTPRSSAHRETFAR